MKIDKIKGNVEYYINSESRGIAFQSDNIWDENVWIVLSLNQENIVEIVKVPEVLYEYIPLAKE